MDMCVGLVFKNNVYIKADFILWTEKLYEIITSIQKYPLLFQNLSVFRRDINDSLKGPNVNTPTANSINDMMT